MRLLVFSDFHLHPFRAFADYTAGDNSRRVLSLKRLASVVKFANEPRNRIDVVVNAGDFTHEATKIDIISALKARKILRELVPPLLSVSGNHDLSPSGHSSMKVIGEDTTSYIDTGKIVMLGDVSHEMAVFHLVPYTKNREAWFKEIFEAQAVGTAGDDSLHILVTHGLVTGTRIYLNGARISDGLNPDLLRRAFDFSIVGHAHLPDLLDNCVLLPGALIPQSFSDEAAGRIDGGNAWVVELHKGERSVVTPIRYENPAFTTIKIAAVDRETADFDTLSEDDFYRVVGSEEELMWFRTTFPGFANGRKCLFITEAARVLMDEATGVEMRTGESPAVLVERYARIRSAETPPIPIEDLIKLGKIILGAPAKMSGQEARDIFEAIDALAE